MLDVKIKSPFKQLHSYLYSFSLEKLHSLVNLKNFAFLYCHYYQEQIIHKNQVENKKSMQKHYTTYVEAFNLILRLCKETLKKALINMESKA